METRANLITVGLFVLAVIAAGFGAAYWLMKGNQTGPRTPVALIFQGVRRRAAAGRQRRLQRHPDRRGRQRAP